MKCLKRRIVRDNARCITRTEVVVHHIDMTPNELIANYREKILKGTWSSMLIEDFDNGLSFKITVRKDIDEDSELICIYEWTEETPITLSV